MHRRPPGAERRSSAKATSTTSRTRSSGTPPRRPSPTRSTSTSKPAFFGNNPWPWVDPSEPPSSTPCPPKPDSTTPLGVRIKFYTVTPCRVADTRTVPTGPRPGPPDRGADPGLPGHGGLWGPGDARAVAANVTVVSPSAAGYLTLFPPGVTSQTSTVNFKAGAHPGEQCHDLARFGGHRLCLLRHRDRGGALAHRRGRLLHVTKRGGGLPGWAVGGPAARGAIGENCHYLGGCDARHFHRFRPQVV